MDKSGNMVLKLLSYNRDDLKAYDSDYWRMCADGKTDGYLMPFETPTGSFSDGYTVSTLMLPSQSTVGLEVLFSLITTLPLVSTKP